MVQVDTIDVQTYGEWDKKSWALFVHSRQTHHDHEQREREVKHWWCDESGLCFRKSKEKSLIECIGFFCGFWCVVFSSFITWHLL